MFSIIPVLLVIANMQVVQPVTIITPELKIGFMSRTPNQMASFYEARGFPKAMRDVLKQQCFITVGILNKSHTKIWLDLSSWQFTVDGKPLKREHRDYWKKRWQETAIPLNKQSTFRWTLIPETLDYLPDEHEGGNIILPFTDKAISLTATFATGENKQGKKLTIHSDTLFCAEDAQ